MTVAPAAPWQRRIDRARELAAADEATRPLLLTYARLLELQRDCYDLLRADHLTGSLERDLPSLRAAARPLLDGVAAIGPAPVAEAAGRLRADGDAAVDALLTDAWRVTSNQPFAARMTLQPYAECLAAGGVRPVGRPAPRVAARACPFCAGVPQLAILQSASAEDGGTRHLMCAICSSVWRTGRFACPSCGEENERHLPYFVATQFPHVRVDACDTCRHYVKTIDLTRLGLAEPVVDEVAAGSLDLWAAEHGYRKIEVNVVGL